MREVEKGVPLPGLYPADAATRARYELEKLGEKQLRFGKAWQKAWSLVMNYRGEFCIFPT